jgi:predicted alpha/beta-fold hydrolase
MDITHAKDKKQYQPPLLVGVGYSVGAIVLGNYVASYGQDCALDVAVSISGALDARMQQYFERSRRVWQPLIAAHQRDQFLNAKWGQRIMQRLGRKDFVNLMRSTNVVVRVCTKKVGE